MFRLLSEGLMLGLSTGVLCLATCAPVYLPILLQKDQGMRSALMMVIQLSAGRFISYAIFGAATGYLGSVVGNWDGKEWLMIASYIMISIYLIFTAVIQSRKEKGICPAAKLSRLSGNAFVVGLITGISICPSFLGAITRAVDEGGAFGGMMIFTGFFVGTTLYFLPFSFLSYLSRKKLFRLIGIFASFFIAFYFSFLAGEKIFDSFNSFVFNYTEEKIYFVNTTGDKDLDAKAAQKFSIINTMDIPAEDLPQLTEKLPEGSRILIATTTVPDDKTVALFKAANISAVYAVMENGRNIDEIYDFLKGYSFKGRKTRGFLFRLP